MLSYNIPSTLLQEIDELQDYIEKYKKGIIDETELKAYRVPFGIYEQRIKGLFMVRIRCAAGIITPIQLYEVGKIAQEYGNGRLHITTRQEIQIHDVKIDNIISILKRLYKIGLSSRGGGGNTVRNITASWDSGISTEEIFDVAPYAIELTNRMISSHSSWLLPRKFKIAFSNSSLDNAYATVNDVGFLAIKKDNKLGFKVFIAGGLGRMPKVGKILHDFISPSEVFEVAEAIKRVFSKYGNRRNKHSSRLRFLWESLGRERFIKLYEESRKEIILEENSTMQLPKEYIPYINENVNLEPVAFTHKDFDKWKNRYVKEQRQKGLYSIIIPLLNGNITGEKIIVLADFLENIGEDTIRFTQSQNISLRNIKEKYLGNVYKILEEISELSKKPVLFSNIIACAGATTCQLGFCNSKGALTAIYDKLQRSDIEIEKVQNIRVNISGCPNSCGQHLLGDIGFFGKVGYYNDKPYPSYNIVLGGKIDGENETLLATKVGEIPAYNLPYFIEKLLKICISKIDKYESFYTYLKNGGREEIVSIINEYSQINKDNKDYFYDWDSTEEFSLKDRGIGECAAGIFDIIDHDLSAMRYNLKMFLNEKEINSKNKFAIETLRYSCRALLITKGIEATPDDNVFELFEENFIKENIIDYKYQRLLELVNGNSEEIASKEEEIKSFTYEIEKLYLSLDDTLQFHLKKLETNFDVTKEVDLRGVKCPLNFVKVKAALSQVNKGDLIKVILDEGEPSENVPKSVEAEGHKIVNFNKIDKSYAIIIKKH